MSLPMRTGVEIQNCENWLAGCQTRIRTPSSSALICHPSRRVNVWYLVSSWTLNCSWTPTPSTWWAPISKGPWTPRNFLPSIMRTSKSPCWWEKWPWMPVSMSGCKKKDKCLKRLCATPWFEVKSAPFSFDGWTTLWEQDNVFVGRFHDRVMVGLQHSDAFNGDLERYPFAFQKFGVTQVRQKLNRVEYPYRTLELT